MADQDDSLSDAFGVGIVGGMGPIVVAGLMVPVRDELSSANAALILMVVVVAAAALGGRTAAVVGAVSATLSFDFFLTRPYLSLAIDSRDDAETALLLLLGGLIVGQVAASARANRTLAAHRQDEIRSIYRLAEQVAGGTEPDEVVATATDELHDLLRLESCHFELPPYRDVFPRIERSGVIERPPGQRITHLRFQRGGFELPTAGAELPVFSRGRHVGRFVLAPRSGVGVSLEERVVAVALADQVGAAIDGRSSTSPGVTV